MAIEELIAAFDRHLTDEHVRAAVQQYLTAIDYQTEYDGETIVFARDVAIYILDKALVVDRRDGSYLAARVVFDPTFSEGVYTGLSHGGTLKILFDLAGAYTDEVYSRSNVIPVT